MMMMLTEIEYLTRVACHGRSALARELAASVLLSELRAAHAEIARLRGGIARVVGRIDAALAILDEDPAAEDMVDALEAIGLKRLEVIAPIREESVTRDTQPLGVGSDVTHKV